MNRSAKCSLAALLIGYVGCASAKPAVTRPAVEPTATTTSATSDSGLDTREVVAALPTASSTSVTTANRPPIATSFTLDGNKLTLPNGFFFAAGGALLDEAASGAALWFVVDWLEAKSYISTLRIEGHTADAGASAQALTEQRALAIATWLVAHGVACDRLIAVGFGNTQPIADNTTTAGKSQNRRFVVVNAALRGRAIGGMALDGGGQAAGTVCK